MRVGDPKADHCDLYRYGIRLYMGRTVHPQSLGAVQSLGFLYSTGKPVLVRISASGDPMI